MFREFFSGGGFGKAESVESVKEAKPLELSEQPMMQSQEAEEVAELAKSIEKPESQRVPAGAVHEMNTFLEAVYGNAGDLFSEEERKRAGEIKWVLGEQMGLQEGAGELDLKAELISDTKDFCWQVILRMEREGSIENFPKKQYDGVKRALLNGFDRAALQTEVSPIEEAARMLRAEEGGATSGYESVSKPVGTPKAAANDDEAIEFRKAA